MGWGWLTLKSKHIQHMKHYFIVRQTDLIKSKPNMPGKKKSILKRAHTLFKKGHAASYKKVADTENSETTTPPPGEPPLLRSANVDCNIVLDDCMQENVITSLSSIECLINTARKHNCVGDLRVNVVGRKFISNSIQLICPKCGYSSEPVKLYKEYKPTKNKYCKNVSTLNAAFAAALLNTSIGPTQARELMQGMGICPGSLNGLNKLTHSVGETVKMLADANLRNERKKLSYMPDVAITVDGLYNNKTHYGKSPFQPATQLTFSILAHDTNDPKAKPKIVDMRLRNKLCRKGNQAHIDGKVPLCPNHPGCTATCDDEQTIGDESQFVTEALELLKKDNVHVAFLCSDGDSAISKQVKKRKESIQLCKDRYHFGRNMKKSLKGLQLSPACFQTKNKKVKQQRQRWFSFDLGTRAEAEFSRALAVARRTKRTNAKIKQRVIKLLKDIPVTILECHTGRCGDSCKKHSKLCKGNNSYAKRCIFKGQVNLKESDEQKILKVLNARLGAEGVGQTFTGISTQCNEALNRSFTKTSPKNVTCSRAFPARASRNALNFNLGFPLSTMLILNEIGHPMTPLCFDSMVRDEKRKQIIRRHAKSRKRKARRHMATIQKYFRYKKNKPLTTYRRGVELGLGL